VLHGEVDEALERFWTDTRERHRFLQHDPERPILPPEEIFLRGRGVLHPHQPHATLALRGSEPLDWARPLPDLSIDRGATEPLGALERHLASTPHRVLIVAESEGRRESLLELLRDHKIDVPSVATLAEFWPATRRWPSPPRRWPRASTGSRPDSRSAIQFVTETELFASTPQARRRRKQEQVSSVDALIKDLSELKVGDPVVHLNHGIGRYQGLINIDLGERGQRVPAPGVRRQGHAVRAGGAAAPDQPLHRRQRRRGAAAQAGLGQWDKARRKAAEQVRDTAAELLNLYARRAAREGFAHRFSAHDYEAFATSFGFEETADQRAAIHAVIQDMISPQADGPPGVRRRRLRQDRGGAARGLRRRARRQAGGDPGAHHAAGRAALPDPGRPLRQVAGEDRRAVALSQPKEVKAALEGIADGTVDIVVGTHKLLSSDVKFAPGPAGHRRGTPLRRAPQGSHEGLRAEVDVLTLTATPIPRTLGMALEGLRDLSVIATAPQRRLAIKTFVRNEGNGTIREAVLRELKRGGQVYFLHNEVETIENRRTSWPSCCPRRASPWPTARCPSASWST
jgi:transcription-repair coupling factor (superfamily II helicase)